MGQDQQDQGMMGWTDAEVRGLNVAERDWLEQGAKEGTGVEARGLSVAEHE